jgi:hypothetical protein
MASGLLSMIATPAQGNPVPDGVEWCADNGCFGKGYPGDDKWLAWLASYTPEQIGRCRFATAPDVVGDAESTLARSLPFLPQIRALGYPAAFVAQDGIENTEIPWGEFDALFVGGSTEFKLGPTAAALVREAKERGKWVHMGRVNSARRMNYARLMNGDPALGCDSADGTFLTFGPDVNLPKVLSWLRKVNTQGVLT